MRMVRLRIIPSVEAIHVDNRQGVKYKTGKQVSHGLPSKPWPVPTIMPVRVFSWARI